MSGHMDNPFNYIYRKDPSIVAREIAGEMILVPIRQNVGDLESIYLLNETARYAWEHFDGESSVANILDQFIQDFDVDKQHAVQDLSELINDLIRVGALVKV